MDIIRCPSCYNLVPEKTSVCPYCGITISTIDKTEVNQEQENLQEVNQKTISSGQESKDHWLDQSMELLSNNILHIVTVGIINNPFFVILSLFLVSAWYHSLLYRFSLAFKEKNTKIKFDYITAFKEGIVILFINSIVLLPFTVILLFSLGLFMYSVIAMLHSTNSTLNFIFFVNYIFLIFYFVFYIGISMSLKFFVLLALSEYKPEDRWDLKDILKKIVNLATKYWTRLMILLFVILIMNFALQNLTGILCYCSLGFIFVFATIPYIILDVVILGYLINDYTNNRMNL